MGDPSLRLKSSGCAQDDSPRFGSTFLLLGDEVGEGGCFAEVDAESAFGAVVGEGDLERVRGFGDLVGFHLSAGEILLLVVGGAGGYVFVNGESPFAFLGNGINGVGAEGDGDASEAEWGLGEEGHGSAAGSEGLAVRNFVVFCGDGVVTDVNLASVVEITAGSGRLGLRRSDDRESWQGKDGDYEASAKHGRPLWAKQFSAETGRGEGNLSSDAWSRGFAPVVAGLR